MIKRFGDKFKVVQRRPSILLWFWRHLVGQATVYHGHHWACVPSDLWLCIIWLFKCRDFWECWVVSVFNRLRLVWFTIKVTDILPEFVARSARVPLANPLKIWVSVVRVDVVWSFLVFFFLNCLWSSHLAVWLALRKFKLVFFKFDVWVLKSSQFPFWIEFRL